MNRHDIHPLRQICVHDSHPDHVGTVVSVRGSVVDVRFSNQLPPLYHRLVTQDDSRVTLEVVIHLTAADYPERARYMIGTVNEAQQP